MPSIDSGCSTAVDLWPLNRGLWVALTLAKFFFLILALTFITNKKVVEDSKQGWLGRKRESYLNAKKWHVWGIGGIQGAEKASRLRSRFV